MPAPAGVLAQLLSAVVHSDSDSGDECRTGEPYRERPLEHSGPVASLPIRHSLHAARYRPAESSASQPRRPSAALRCRVAGCTQKQCADGVGGLCVAHAILSLPVRQAHSGDTPLSLAAYQRKLRRHSQPRRTDGSPLPEAARWQPQSRPATAVTARTQRSHSYRRYDEDEGRREEADGRATARLPEFTQRLPTVADLKDEGLQAFTAARSDARRSKHNSRNNSRRSTMRWNATAPEASGADAQHVDSSPHGSTLLFHSRRTPAGLALERAHTAAEAIRMLRLATHNRPHSATATLTSAAAAHTFKATGAVMDGATLPLAPALYALSTDVTPTCPPLILSTTPAAALSLLLVAPAKHMKVLSAVEEQRLYRADLLARLLQRPPVACLQWDRLRRMETLLAYRPPHATLCSRQWIRSHSEHDSILAAWREKRKRLNAWLATRCAVGELYKKRAMWDVADSVRSRTGRLDEWMAGRLARHAAGKQHQGKHNGRVGGWHMSTFSAADDEVDSQSVDEPQLSIVVLEPSPRSAATVGKQSVRGAQPLVPQLALPQLHA